MDKDIIKEVRKEKPNLLMLATIVQSASIHHDKEADVLYIAYERNTKADDTLIYNDFFVRVKKKKILGVTVLNASSYMKSSNNSDYLIEIPHSDSDRITNIYFSSTKNNSFSVFDWTFL